MVLSPSIQYPIFWSKLKRLISEPEWERHQDEPGICVMPENMKVLKKKNDGGISQEQRSQNEVTFIGHIKDNLSI